LRGECACYSKRVHDPLQGAQPPQGQAQHFDPNLPGGQHFGMAPLAPQQDGWGKIGVVMVALAVVFAGGVAYFIATSGSSEEGAKSAAAMAIAEDGGTKTVAAFDAAAVAETEPVAPSSDGVAEPDEAAEPDVVEPAADELAEMDAGTVPDETEPEEVGGQIGLLRANGEVDRPAGLVSLAIESEPSGATVIRKRDGVRLGTTPYRYEVETSRADVAFVLKLDGHRSMIVSMPGNKDSVRQVMLLPGSGGAAIPAPSVDESEPSKPATVVSKNTPKKPTSKVTKPKRPSTAKRPSKPKTPSKPKPPKKPKGGKVDYQADPIPL